MQIEITLPSVDFSSLHMWDDITENHKSNKLNYMRINTPD